LVLRSWQFLPEDQDCEPAEMAISLQITQHQMMRQDERL